MAVMPSEERAVTKAQAYVLSKDLPNSFTIGKINVNITKISYDEKTKYLVVDLYATYNGKKIDIKAPYQYYNPPICYIDENNIVKEDLKITFTEMIKETLNYIITKYKL